jgi:hypothetical protein
MTDSCEAETVEECSDKYEDIDDLPEEDKEKPEKTVGFPVKADKHFAWQKHADEHYKGRYSRSKHKGVISKMVKEYVKVCMEITNQFDTGSKDPHEFIQESAMDSGNILKEKQKLRKKLEEKESKIRKLENQVEEAKNQQKIAEKSGIDKIRFAIKMAVKDEPKTYSEIGEELEEIGIEAKNFENLPNLPRNKEEDRKANMGEIVSKIVQQDPEIVEKDAKEVNDYIEFTKYGYEAANK